MIITVEEARRRGLLGRSRRAKRPDPPASYHPHRAVILGIDSAKVSGWGILRCDSELGTMTRFLDYGESGIESKWRGAVVTARHAESRFEIPLVVVMETWTTGGRADRRMGPSTLLGLGEARGRWRALLRDLGHPKRRIVSVNTTWRAAILGSPMNRTSDLWKVAAQQYVRNRFGVDCGPNAAEALCIASWGSQSGRVGALLPKRR